MPPETRIHAFTDDALGTLDAVALAHALHRGELSQTEVAAAAINRAELINPRLRGIVTSDYDRAREQARVPATGDFAGVPFLIKDNTPVAGLATGFGSDAINGKPALKHSVVSKQLLDQGFIHLGKSSLPEFGFNASTEYQSRHPTLNPWHTHYSCGASSGGSAAMVAAGVVPIAHANDGGGSIRIPAACCGLVGLKPSRGRLRDGEAAASLPVNIISEGVLTRTVRDTAAFYAAIERQHRPPQLPQIGDVRQAGKLRRRIGLMINPINGAVTDQVTRQAAETIARRLSDAGHKVEIMQPCIDPRFATDFARYWAMLGFLVSHSGKLTMEPSFQRRQVDNLTRGLEKKCLREMHKLPGSLWRLRRCAWQYRKDLAGYDAILTPVLAHTTPMLGFLSPHMPFQELFQRLQHYVCFTPLANAAGTPAIALPAGQTAEGLPVGIQLMGHYGQERLLLELAFELEEIAPWSSLYNNPQARAL